MMIMGGGKERLSVEVVVTRRKRRLYLCGWSSSGVNVNEVKMGHLMRWGVMEEDAQAFLT